MADALFVDTEARPDALIGRVLNKVSRFFAVCAGFMLLLMSLMSLASIVGRSLFDKPVLGDYELVQMMSAIAVTMSLPFCQMIRGHIIVDFFTTGMPARVKINSASFSPTVTALPTHAARTIAPSSSRTGRCTACAMS